MSSSSSTFVSGGSPTAAQVNGWAQGTIGYAQATSNQGSITTGVDLTSLSVPVTLVAGRRIRITGSTYPSSTVTSDRVTMTINEGGTQLQEGSIVPTSSAIHIERSVVLTPSAGSHTYKLTMARSVGSGTVTSNASATFPAFILVEDIGAV